MRGNPYPDPDDHVSPIHLGWPSSRTWGRIGRGLGVIILATALLFFIPKVYRVVGEVYQIHQDVSNLTEQVENTGGNIYWTWANSRDTIDLVKQLGKKNDDTNTKLDQLLTNGQQTANDLATTKAQLATAQADLKTAQALLSTTKSDLATAQNQLKTPTVSMVAFMYCNNLDDLGKTLGVGTGEKTVGLLADAGENTFVWTKTASGQELQLPGETSYFVSQVGSDYTKLPLKVSPNTLTVRCKPKPTS